jgi:hypothetical protein
VTTATKLPVPAVKLFSGLPDKLREELLLAYREVVRNYMEHRWEPSELNGGKLCEAVYTILKGHIGGQYPQRASKPSNMLDACRALEQASSSFPRSVRIQIPRMLIALYEIRNNRGVGHVGGDVNPNQMDATCVLYMVKWIMADLVRIFHNVDVLTATTIVDTIVERVLPTVWEVAGKRRVIDTETTMKEKTLLLLYSLTGPASEKDLIEWAEHSNASVYRRTVLIPLHKAKLLEYDRKTSLVHLSPKGAAIVEKNLLSQ